MVAAHSPVDIAALKERHPLGEVVEAAGVRLRGRGRVRQGVCPFHEEAEGSFTVYADTERWYCFGCGEGGDVLDFLQRSRRPEPAGGDPAVRRLAARNTPGSRQPATRQGGGSAARPGAADGRGAVLRGRSLRRSPRGAGVPRLAGHRPRHRDEPRPRLRAGARAARGARLRRLRRRTDPRERAVRRARRALRRDGGRPRGRERTHPLAGGTGHRPRSARRASRRCPAPSPCSGMGRLGPAPPWAVVTEGVFDWLLLTRVGPARLRRPRHAGHGASGRRPARLPPRLPRLRQRRRRARGHGGARRPARPPRRRRDPARRASPTWPTWPRSRRGAESSCACSNGRPAPPANPPIPPDGHRTARLPTSRAASACPPHQPPTGRRRDDR